MIAWVATHAAALQVAIGVLTLLVWLAYLQIFLVSFRRQRRTAIMINTGVGAGLNARCFVSNLGLEPIYLLQILVRVGAEGDTRTAVITDRSELERESLNDPSHATNRGPLRSGQTIDIGSFAQLLDRARGQIAPPSVRRVDRLGIVVCAASAATEAIVGAERTFDLRRGGSSVTLAAATLSTRQIRSRRARRRLERELAARL